MVVGINSGLVYQSLPNVYNITDSFTFAAVQSCYQSPSIATHVCHSFHIISHRYAAMITITIDNLAINDIYQYV
jgi:hypothetical protein